MRTSKGRPYITDALACLTNAPSNPPLPLMSSVLAGDRHVVCVAFPLSAAAVVVSALASGLLAAAFVEAAGAAALGVDSQPAVAPSAFPAGVSARGCAFAAPAAAAAFAVPVGACAPTRHHGCFVADSARSGYRFVVGFRRD